MGEAAQILGLALAATVAGVVYVVAHEKRRKHKKLNPKPQPAPAASTQENVITSEPSEAPSASQLAKEGFSVVSVIEKGVLLKTLYDTATAAFSLIEQTRRAVVVLHKEQGRTLEEARDMVQADFQTNMSTVIRAVHLKHSVNDQQINASLKYYKDDPKVCEGFKIMQAALQGEAPPPPPQPSPTARSGKLRKKRG